MSLAVDGNAKLSKALKLHADVLEYVISLSPHDFERLRNPLMRRLMPPRIALARIAKMTQTPLGELLRSIHEAAHIELTDDERRELDALDGSQGHESPPEDAPSWATQPARTVDLLEGDERLDADPMLPISRAVKGARVGEVILIKHKWEPQPLYDIWAKIGVDHFARQVNRDEWWIFIRKTPGLSE